MAKLLQAELTIEKCPAELWLNDIPIARLAPAGPTYVSVPAHMYLVDGENFLEVIAGPGPEPAHARDRAGSPLPPDSAAHARIKALDPGQFTDDENAPVPLHADWTGGETGGEMGAEMRQSPQIVGAKADLGPLFGPWAWQSAPRVALDAPMIARLSAVLERIRASLQRGDASVLAALAQPKFEAGARAYPARSYDATVAQFRAAVERYAKTPGWSMQPLNPERFSFRLGANGRLIECIDKDWKATLRSVPLSSGFPNYFPMFFGMHNGEVAVYL